MSIRSFNGLIFCAISVLALLPSRSSAVVVSYTFDDPSDSSTVVADSSAGDGAQNGTFNFDAARSATGGIQGTAGVRFPGAADPGYASADGFVMTNASIKYPNQMTWSALVKPTEVASSGYEILFWDGPSRGPGETGMTIYPDGSLVWQSYQGSGSYATVQTSSSVFTVGVWQAIGITFDGTVGGGTAIVYRNGLPVQTFTGLGSLVNNGNANDTDPTVFGIGYGLSGASGARYIGYADNIFMAGRALSASEMVEVQALPEPVSAGVLLIACAAGAMRRRGRGFKMAA
jgi:hypothetical protein